MSGIPREQRVILLTGATGYVGGRLLGVLEKSGWKVRCLTRNPEHLRQRVSQSTDIVKGDVRDLESLVEALRGVDTAYYLVHSMGTGKDFEKEDRKAATNFADAATTCGVKRIIYLGGLGNPDHRLSKHLRSRQETGNLLRRSTAQIIEFRASIIIGSGSLSFELIRALVERLPIMICPKWVNVLAQPIAIEDVLDYLVAAVDLPHSDSRIFEIGGPDQVSYGQIMQHYARQRGLRRLMIPVPILTPYLSSLWLGLVTPLYSRVGRKLVDSLRNPTLISNNLAENTFSIKPRGIGEAIDRALVREDQAIAETRWFDALSSSGKLRTWGGVRFGSRLVDSRSKEVNASAAACFAPIQRIGGKQGWYFGNFLWRIRGFLDLMVGGVGIRRGRRHPIDLKIGDAVDFWRVENIDQDHLLRLRAEMKLPGRAWLEFEVTPGKQGTTIWQTAVFDPVGLSGLIYWYALYPLHQIVFAGMLRNIARAASDGDATEKLIVNESAPSATSGNVRSTSERHP